MLLRTWHTYLDGVDDSEGHDAGDGAQKALPQVAVGAQEQPTASLEQVHVQTRARRLRQQQLLREKQQQRQLRQQKQQICKGLCEHHGCDD
jgi:hypothetical protein